MRQSTRRLLVWVGVATLAGSLVVPGVSYATRRTSGPDNFAQAHVASSCGVNESATLRVITRPEPCTIAVTLTSSFIVVLDPGFRWSAPRSSSPALGVTNVTRPSSQRVSARVTALALGRATLTSEGAIICRAGQACPALARLWVINVVVVRSLSSPRVVAVTQVDGGRHVALHIGDRLAVRLSGPSNYTWTAPTSSKASIVRVLVGTGGRVASSSLVAVSIGTVRVTAIDNPNCYPMCLAPSQQFSLDVTVTR